MTADALVTATGDVALLGTLLTVWLTLWGMTALLATYLRPVCAADDAGSGRYLVR